MTFTPGQRVKVVRNVFDPSEGFGQFVGREGTVIDGDVPLVAFATGGAALVELDGDGVEAIFDEGELEEVYL